jgi:hypothetical protein
VDTIKIAQGNHRVSQGSGDVVDSEYDLHDERIASVLV